MGSFSSGTITLNSLNNAYYAGQMISGNVSFTLEMPTTLTVITVTFTGEALVQWQDTDGERCTGNEHYFNVTVPLCGGNGLFTLPPGQHQYPFQYQIPFEVPGTYSDGTGTVRYCIQAAADSPSVCRETIKKVFTVVAPLDLNKNNDCKQPIEMEFEQEDSGCCLGSRPVRIQFRVPVSGFCPGQTIPIHVSVDNKSSVEVRRLLFELISVSAYRSQLPTTELITPPEVVARMKRGPILCKTKGDFVVNFPVPEMIAPNLYICGIMGIEYSLRVTVKMTGCNKDESDQVPIYLGHVPLTGSQDYETPLKEKLPIGPIPTMPLQATESQPVPYQYQAQNAGTPQQNIPYPQVPPYLPPQVPNMPYAAHSQQHPTGNNIPYSPGQAETNLPYLPYPGQNAAMLPPQWDGGSYPQIGFTNVSPSAPSL